MDRREILTSIKSCMAAGMLGAVAGASCKAAASATAFTHMFSIQHDMLPNLLSLIFYSTFILLSWISWMYYVKGLEGIPSLQATVVTSTANSLSMGCIAWLVFAEQLSIKWLFGVCFMLMGVYLLSKAPIQKAKPG